MKNISFVLVFFFSFVQLTGFSTSSITHYAKNWALQCDTSMTQEELITVLDFVYLLYINAILDAKIQASYKPLLELYQTVRNNLSDPLNPNQELIQLKTFAEKCEKITALRAFYTQLLDDYLVYYNTHKTDQTEQALLELQLYISETIRTWADKQEKSTTLLLKESSPILLQTGQNLYSVANFYTALSNGNLPFIASKEDKSLAIFNAVVKNSSYALFQIDLAHKIINDTTDNAMNTVCLGRKIYAEYYHALYTIIEYHELHDFCLSNKEKYLSLLADIEE